MPMVNFKCNKCGNSEEFYSGPNFKDEIPEKCPKCNEGTMEGQFPNCSKVGFEYQYGKKAYRKNMTPLQQAEYLVKGEDGKFKDPY
jgi:predicted nucleic acid-binding Zn ribbon protein